jgi:small basic protein
MTPNAHPHRRPLWLGLLIAPWAAPFALALMSAWLDGDADLHETATFIEVFAFALVFGLPVAYLGLAALGLPMTIWLRRRGRLAAWRIVLVAAPLGSAVLVAALVAFGAKLGMVAQLGIGAALGIAVAFAFCLVCGIPWHARSR